MAELKQLYDLLDGIMQMFDEFLATEKSKLEALKVGNVDQLDEYMKKEQAYTMQMKGFDIKREALQKELGYGGLKMREIIGQLDGEDKAKLQELHERFSMKTEELQTAMAAVKDYIEIHTKTIDEALAKKEEYERGGYDPEGDVKEESDKPRFTESDV